MERSRGGHEDPVAGNPGHSPTRDPAATPPDAFADVYRRYHDAVWRTLCALGVPEAAADDATQEVFLVVYRRMGDPDQYDTLKSWVYGIARRVAWRHHRTTTRSRRREALAVVEPTEPPTAPDDRVAQQQAAGAMQRFLDALDPKIRDVFVLADIEGLSAPEIAAVVGAKVSTVYSRLRLARRRFDAVAHRQQAKLQREGGR